jgi:hypothetical protein
MRPNAGVSPATKSSGSRESCLAPMLGAIGMLATPQLRSKIGSVIETPTHCSRVV